MKYKVGDEVVLRDDLEESGNPEDHYINDMEYLKNTAHAIGEVGILNNYMIDDWFVTGDMIDHEKTAELQTDRVVKHYTNELEKVVTEKNKVDIPADNIKPSHYRKGEVDLIESWYQTMPFDGFRWAMKSHIMKYIYRFEEKNGAEDLDKATYYIERLKEKEMEQGET